MTDPGVRLKRSHVEYLAQPRTSGCAKARTITSTRAGIVSKRASSRAWIMYESATRNVAPNIRNGTMRSSTSGIDSAKMKSVSASHSTLLT